MVSQGVEPGASGTISVTAAGGWLSFFLMRQRQGRLGRLDDGRTQHVVDPYPARDLSAGLLATLPISGIISSSGLMILIIEAWQMRWAKLSCRLQHPDDGMITFGIQSCWTP